MSVLALIPAKQRSTGCPGKNWRNLANSGESCVTLAVKCARDASCDPIVVSTDRDAFEPDEDTRKLLNVFPPYWTHLQRPKALAQDDTPMIDVVQHALEQIPGPPEQIIVLLQPTQPFRTPEHVKQAIALLQTSGADSVVSVREVPAAYNMAWQLRDTGAGLQPWITASIADVVPRRQELIPSYMRDGTCYAFSRATVECYGNIYGQDVRPLIIPPEDSCELDTEADWREVERRWKEQHG